MDIKQEDLIKFWTWCGFRKDMYLGKHFLGWRNDTGFSYEDLPEPNLENIYFFAIPKLQKKLYATELYAWGIRGFTVKIYKSTEQKYVAEAESDNPTEALYKAIMEVIENASKHTSL